MVRQEAEMTVVHQDPLGCHGGPTVTTPIIERWTRAHSLNSKVCLAVRFAGEKGLRVAASCSTHLDTRFQLLMEPCSPAYNEKKKSISMACQKAGSARHWTLALLDQHLQLTRSERLHAVHIKTLRSGAAPTRLCTSSCGGKSNQKGALGRARPLWANSSRYFSRSHMQLLEPLSLYYFGSPSTLNACEAA